MVVAHVISFLLILAASSVEKILSHSVVVFYSPHAALQLNGEGAFISSGVLLEMPQRNNMNRTRPGALVRIVKQKPLIRA